MRKDTLAIIGSIVLFLILCVLFALEITHPQGGAAMFSGLFGAH